MDHSDYVHKKFSATRMKRKLSNDQSELDNNVQVLPDKNLAIQQENLQQQPKRQKIEPLWQPWMEHKPKTSTRKIKATPKMKNNKTASKHSVTQSQLDLSKSIEPMMLLKSYQKRIAASARKENFESYVKIHMETENIVKEVYCYNQYLMHLRQALIQGSI